MKKVVFRVDSSVDIGSGHVMRCLTLADALSKENIVASFICRDLKGNLIDLIKEKNYKVYILPEETNTKRSSELFYEISQESDAEQCTPYLKLLKDIEWVVIDHYALDYRWQEKIKPFVKKIMVIDDLADRIHHCDVLLDQNYYEDFNQRYNSLVPKKCKMLLGPKYALLRSEFNLARRKMKKREGIVHSILISFGGSDPTNETKKVLDALIGIESKHIHVVVGSANIYKDEIKNICNKAYYIDYYCQIENMAELMISCDLAIGAGGSTTWERCCVGLPSIIVSTAANQVELAENISKNHMAIYLGPAQNLSVSDWKKEINEMLEQKHSLMEMSNKGLKMIDGNGVFRVVNELIK